MTKVLSKEAARKQSAQKVGKNKGRWWGMINFVEVVWFGATRFSVPPNYKVLFSGALRSILEYSEQQHSVTEAERSSHIMSDVLVSKKRL